MASLWTWDSRRGGKLRLLVMSLLLLLLLHCWAQYFRYTLEMSYDFFDFFLFSRISCNSDYTPRKLAVANRQQSFVTLQCSSCKLRPQHGRPQGGLQ
jgi:hypothetical protein